MVLPYTLRSFALTPVLNERSQYAGATKLQAYTANGRDKVMYCIVLYCIVRISSQSKSALSGVLLYVCYHEMMETEKN